MSRGGGKTFHKKSSGSIKFRPFPENPRERDGIFRYCFKPHGNHSIHSKRSRPGNISPISRMHRAIFRKPPSPSAGMSVSSGILSAEQKFRKRSKKQQKYNGKESPTSPLCASVFRSFRVPPLIAYSDQGVDGALLLEIASFSISRSCSTRFLYAYMVCMFSRYFSKRFRDFFLDE